MEKITVLADTREHYPLFFGGDFIVEKLKLEYGDYSIKGWEDRVLFERKGTVAEISINCFGKDWARFRKELEYLSTLDRAEIVCEFPFSQIEKYPWAEPTMPTFIKRRIKVKPHQIIKRIDHIESTYGIPFVYCGSPEGAAEYIADAFKEIAG